MKTFIFLFLIGIFSMGFSAQAESYRRSVEFEWDAIEGAKSYELEIQGPSKVHKFSTKEPLWSGALVPGVYMMKVRAKDHRGVPGDWSEPAELKVQLEAAKLLSPEPEQKIQSEDHNEHSLAFKWARVPGAEKYTVEIRSENGEILKQETLNKEEFQIDLPVAKNYSWKVKAFGLGMESDETQSQNFTLIGQRLDSPKLEKPENKFVRQIKWNKPDHVSSFQYVLEKLNPKSKEWEKVSENENYPETELSFDPHWTGGRYRLKVQARGPLRASSSKPQIEFQVKDGDRSPAAEEIATLRQSIDRLSGWYSIASYLITMIDYKGKNYDKTNATLNYEAIGGTGRLGAGYLSFSSPWGFLGIMDLSGISVEGSGTYTFASAEGNIIYRSDLGGRGELRQQFGLFYKELPETLGLASGAITENNLLKAIGPHYGLEYWLALTPKLGFQLNAHLYPSLMKVATPTNENMRPTLSAQFGLLGSYRLKRNLTGLVGYAYRQDQMDYKAKTGFGSAGSNDYNSVQISGHYLNLFLEWAL